MIKSINELISKKNELDEKKNKIYEFFSENLQSVIKYKKATWNEVCNIADMGNAKAAPYIIYKNVVEPDLTDSNLQNTFVKPGNEPNSIVTELFTVQEIHDLAELIVNGENKKDATKEIKN